MVTSLLVFGTSSVPPTQAPLSQRPVSRSSGDLRSNRLLAGNDLPVRLPWCGEAALISIPFYAAGN